MKATIYIDKQGNISGLADDFIDKLDMGRKVVKRVSDVEWSHDQQQWEARDLSGELIAYGPIRSEVIQAERDYFNQQTEKRFANA